jgi:DNA polymerase
LSKTLQKKSSYLNQNSELFGNEIIIDLDKSFSGDLSSFQSQICKCRNCPLGHTRTNFVFGEGDPNAELLIIGEAPGEKEDLEGRPFVGRSGKLLDKILLAINRNRQNGTYICNIIKCRPPSNRNPNREEINQCLPYLKHQINLVKPKLIVVLGLVAAKNLLNIESSLKDLRGKIHSFHDFPLIVTYHPAFLLRSPGFKKEAWIDFQIIRDFLKD